MRLEYLGILPYSESLRLQRDAAEARKRGDTADTLYLLQHSPVITLGRFKGETDVTASYAQLRAEGISLVKTNRGGSATYHGPGQIIGYPVMNLKENGIDIPTYIWNLEEVIIRSLVGIGILGCRVDKYTGVWVNKKKICSIGINVDRSVTTHGFALNVNNDLTHFQFIRPCGLNADVMTSVSEQLGYLVQLNTVTENIVKAFSDVFRIRFEKP